MLESILLLAGMSILLIGSPGPAAMALAATGAQHSWKQGLPLVAGLICGAQLTGLLTSAGVLALLNRWPEARLTMQAVGGTFVLLMALRMLSGGTKVIDDQGRSRTTFGFRSGILMNILNPKAYAVFMLLISNYLPPMPSPWQSVLLLEAVALLASLLVASGWLLLGLWLGRMISSPIGQQRLRALFAALMVIFVLPMLRSIPD
ncbi:LysE family translocator [Motiliproteus sp.]|uniref:LysE family translocator n=1 Tax=Motiliproteus sp. TaxID=1898955 RepID=UPI003BAA2E1C